MAYSLVGFLAIFVHLIINSDVIFGLKKGHRFSGEIFYLLFLLSVILYHVTDGIWGILYDQKLVEALFFDTTIYFITMASSILLWGLYVYYYLGEKNKLITYVGVAVFTFQIVLIIINFFTNILFVITPECVYEPKPLRYVMLTVQIFMFLMLAIYTLISAIKTSGSLRRHHITITIFCVFMMVSITLQVFFPLYPMYSLGYLFGICVLHTYVVEDEQRNQKYELEEVKHRISNDPLTGSLSKYAYIDIEAEIDEKINNGNMEDFAMVVFDLNDLKLINDTKGHDAGDNYIINAVRLIEKYFVDAPLYRVGGDEFTAILMGVNYTNRERLVENFNHVIDDNVKKNETLIISAGLSTYMPEKDGTILQTFTRADREMYKRKSELKEMKNKGE